MSVERTSDWEVCFASCLVTQPGRQVVRLISGYGVHLIRVTAQRVWHRQWI